jgi:hypothetical protein
MQPVAKSSLSTSYKVKLVTVLTAMQLIPLYSKAAKDMHSCSSGQLKSSNTLSKVFRKVYSASDLTAKNQTSDFFFGLKSHF